MLQQKIEKLYIMEKTQTAIIVKTRYEFREDKKYQWLQRLCFIILGKIGAYQKYFKTEIEFVELDPTDTVNSIAKQYNCLWEHRGRRPTRLIIGEKNFRELAGSCKSLGYFTFQGRAEESKDIRKPVYLDMEVTVVPWMEGFVVLP